MYLRLWFFYFLFLFACCNNNTAEKNVNQKITKKDIDKKSQNEFAHIKNIPLPEGFERLSITDNSFAEYLQNVPLKKDKTVYLFDGSEKINQHAQFAVLSITVGQKNLQQCADAVMRLRAEYLFANKRYEEIRFTDNNGKEYNFKPPYTTEHFKVYLNVVFGMCGSASLVKQLKTVKQFYDIKAGDVLIRGGFPGHAVIVMDVAINADLKKIYLLAQSYMPAQDIHVLLNPLDGNYSPWYLADENITIVTPEYLFKKNELKTW